MADYRKTAAVAVFLSTMATHAAATLDRGGIDDAYITYTFARNLAQGHGIVWSPGTPPLYASSTMTWLLLLAAVAGAGGSIPFWSMLLGAAGWGLVNALLFGWVRRQAGWGPGLAFGVLGVVSLRAVDLSLGMETAFFTSLVLLMFTAARAGRLTTAGLLGALVGLTRLDGLVAVALVAAHLAAGPSERCRKALLAFGVPFLAVMGAGCAGLFLTFGDVVPTSFRAKLLGPGLSPPFTPAGFGAALAGFPEERLALVPLLVLPLSVLGLVRALLQARDADSLPGLWAIAHAAAFSLSRLPETSWYYAAVLPVMLASAALGAAALGGALERRGLPGLLSAFLALAPLLATTALSTRALAARLQQDPRGTGSRLENEHLNLARLVNEDREARGLAQVSVIAPEIGHLGYFVPGRVHDLMGLVSPEVVRRGPYLGPRLLLEETRADDVLLFTDLYAVPLAAVLQAPTFLRDYVETQTQLRTQGDDYRLYRRQPGAWRRLVRLERTIRPGDAVDLPAGLAPSGAFAVCVEAVAHPAAESSVDVDTGRGFDTRNALPLWLAEGTSQACGRHPYPGVPRRVRVRVNAPASARVAVKAVEVVDGLRESLHVARERPCLTPPTGPLQPFANLLDLTHVSAAPPRVFAHPPSGFAFDVPGGAVVTGTVDLDPSVAGKGGDGATFEVHRDGARAWWHHQPAAAPPTPFRLRVPEPGPGRVGFVTLPGPSGSRAFDWARWQIRVEAPGLDFTLPVCRPPG